LHTFRCTSVCYFSSFVLFFLSAGHSLSFLCFFSWLPKVTSIRATNLALPSWSTYRADHSLGHVSNPWTILVQIWNHKFIGLLCYMLYIFQPLFILRGLYTATTVWREQTGLCAI
jgi:hypothetical protein